MDRTNRPRRTVRSLPALLALALLALLAPMPAPAALAAGSSCANTPDTFLQSWIDGASTGGTVRIKAGTYVGSIQINKNLTLVGAGQTTLCGGSPVITVLPGAQVTISGLTITGGAGAIFALGNYPIPAGQLTVDAITITGNTYSERTGWPTSGIYVDGGGSLTVNHSTFSSNAGPAIYSFSPVTVNNSTFSNNDFGLVSRSGALTVNNSDFSGGSNYAISSASTSLLINSSRISGNGGGICATGSGTIVGSTISDNTSTSTECLVDWNLSVGMGIFLAGAFTVRDSLISGNARGLAVNNGTSKVIDTTITGNQANDGAGVEVGGDGGPKLELIDSTVSGNIATGGTGAGLEIGPQATVTLRNTAIAGNTSVSSGQAGTDCANTSGNGVISSDGYNFVGNDACFFNTSSSGVYNVALPTDKIGGDGKPAIDAKLGALADNGGATQTLAPLAGSPLVGAGACTDDQNNLITYDQRLAPRPSSGCDIGAFQSAATAPPTGVSLVPGNGRGPDGILHVYWDIPTTLTAGSCPGGAATFQLVNRGQVLQSGTMTEGPAGSYHASIPPLKPNSAEPGKSSPAQVQISVVCPFAPPLTLSMALDIYIDPSGVVKDVATGQPLAGATVTLYRSDSAAGPFAAVANGDTTVMSPDNATNPQTTGADGRFGWDVTDGYYQVRAAKAGCVSAANPGQTYAESDVLQIPPAVTGVELDLNCNTDSTPPVTTASVTVGTPGANGWYLGPVSVTLAATDNQGGSGIKATYDAVDNAACAPAAPTACSTYGAPFAVTGDGTHTVTYFSIDTVGNAEAAKTLTINIDTTPPGPTKATLSGGTAGSNGWYTAAPSIALASGDATSGLAAIYAQVVAHGAATPGSALPGGWTAYAGPFAAPAGDGDLYAFSLDNAGNAEAPVNLGELKVDSAPPATTATPSGAAGSNGWYTGNVTVALAAADNAGGSGVASITYSATGAQPIAGTTVNGAGAAVAISAEGTTTLTYAATDNAGNAEAPKTLTVKLDKTPPAITCGAADGNWHAADVAIACTAADGGSGLANATDAGFSLATSVPAGTETADAGTGSHQVCDLAGNCATAGPIGGNKVDKKAPAISITSPTAGAYTLNQAVAASYACSDGGSGVAPCAGPVASGSSIDTASVGAKTFAVSAKDNVGNAAGQSVSYSVQYAGGTCDGAPGHAILAPIQADGSSVFKQGSTVPAKFRVCDANGVSIGTAGVVTSFQLVQQATSSGTLAVNEPVTSTTPDTAFRWDATGQQWIFNIATANLASNTTDTYQITLNDGSAITFSFGLK